jgi:hypothetical protein
MGDRTRLILSSEINASNVTARIAANQPVTFDNCIIVGDLNISALKIDEQLHFNHTIFQGSVNFNNVEFNGDAYFRLSKFNREAHFRSSKFNRVSSFFLTTFCRNIDFTGTIFNDTAGFYDSIFTNSTCYADFGSAKFNGIAEFGYSKFNSSYVNFDSCKFNSNANFLGSKINSSTYFTHSEFNGIANFSDSKFTKVTSFNGSQFIKEALFEGADLDCTLYLTRTKYDKLYIRWRDIKNLGYDDAAYLSLIDNFKRLGYFNDANDCYFAYMDNSKPTLSYYVAKSLGFGVRSDYIVEFAILTLIIFGFFYSYGYYMDPRSRTSYKRAFFLSLMFSAMALFSLPREVFPSGNKYDASGNNYDKLMESHLYLFPEGTARISLRLVFASERLIGWGLLILFINTLSRVMLYRL